MTRNIQGYLGLILLLCSLQVHGQTSDIVRYNISQKYHDPKQAYYIDLLELVLTASTPKYGAYKLVPVVIEMSQGRSSIMVQQNDSIDITWRMTSVDIEKQLQAIYFPILKGVLGYRVFIIRKSDQQLYSLRTSKKQLQQLLAGQGHDWPDSLILRDNDFNLITANANLLLEMLEKKRFDYFPRALHEPWLELVGKTSLMVEQHLLLKYPAPMYFFVSKENVRLHQRIKYGLSVLINSGEFEHFFHNHPVTKDMLLKAKIEKRKVFELTNPLLSEESKKLLSDSQLWLALTEHQ